MYCVRSLLFHLRQFQKVTNIRPVNNVKQYINQRNYCFPVEDESEKMIEEICEGNPEVEKKLRILMLEVEVMRQDGRYAPSSLQRRHWEHLIDLPSRNQRTNYLTYLFKTEKSKENQKAKKQAKRQERELSVPEETKEFPDDLTYGIGKDSLFLRIRDQSINNFDNYRALQSIIDGQEIVIDCSYEDYMVHREILNAAKQMTLVFGDNRIHKAPFNIHMCNVNFQGTFMKQLERNIPSVLEPWFPLNIQSNSYLDIFPKQKLVYLTPHCREELTHFDHDAVYIIGCMVDKINSDPLSLAKAKKNGIKMAKLPLERYLEWGPGSKKNLNINHMVPILLDLKLTGDWEFALRHIPRRKLMETQILAMQKKIRNPLFKDEIFKNFKSKHSSKIAFKDKRMKSLYDDDSI